MKLVSILVMALLLLALTTQAQDVSKSVVFGGGAYDNPEKAFVSSVGYGAKAGPVWLMAHGKFGQNGALESEVAYFLTISGGLTLGLVAGPGADWVSDPYAAPVSYLTGAGGGLLGYHWDKVGIYVGGKYKFTYQDGTAYPTGWRVGLWLAYNP